ncbi:MAG: HEAT repeat domain-containing protein [Myxococcota bacterium]|nr:HEAT repeat domain-containing protein [Myxococcota bacterium]
MQPAADPFQPLLHMIDRYRSDVHELRPPPSDDTLAGAVDAIGQPLPPSLRAFLERWNGAVLFRGALRIRAATALAPAADEARRVVVFADGPATADRWAFAPGELGGTLFGRWNPGNDMERGWFEPMHDRFDSWLIATLRILDEDVRQPAARLQTRREVDPLSGHLLLAEADAVLGAGDPDSALILLRKATAADPGRVASWSRLGEVQLGADDNAARFAFLKALRATRLPAPWPARDAADASLIRTLERLFPPGDDGWERELTWFLDEAVSAPEDPAEALMVEAAVLALARCWQARGERHAARDVLRQRVSAIHDFPGPHAPVEATLALARIEADLGDADAAERQLRALRAAPAPAPARAALEFGAMAVERQEPWAESLLAQAIEGLAPPRVGPDVWAPARMRAWILLVERHLERNRPEAARHALGEAAALSDRVSDGRLTADMMLATGDVHLAAGEHDAAATAWQGARKGAKTDPVLLHRLLVRHGDLARAQGRPDDAADSYRRAVQGFHALDMPLQGAWAALRLAATGERAAVAAARTAFKAADLAAGVESADAIEGDATRSLDWHLERTGEHARDRANAQRARPPLSRADAERPERRIGAHRAAIASADVSVVPALARELDACSRTVARGTPRLSDPTLARYVAAADLLAGHRSFEAAEVLLHQLLEVRPAGAVGRALVGAMARSPNAALVDGLLEALTRTGMEPTGIALAAEVLGWRREAAAVPVLRTLIAPGSPRTARKAAVVALGRIGDRASIDILIELLDEPALSEEVSTALLLLGEWQGVDAQAQTLTARKPNTPAAIGEIVGRYGGPNYLLLLFRSAALEGAPAVGAMMGMGYLGDPRAVPRLIDACGARDPARARIAGAALELITGHHEDPEESLLRNRWGEWWEREGGRYQEGLRYRHGRLLDPGLLIERLAHDDAIVRRSTYDELVISTGHRLPFDAEGPWRVQVNHLQAWRAWWNEQKGRFPAGRWFFHGDVIG